uniref:Uncharacterized protein n=1 Tax=Arundo donax TaxID=35708 RepID=A0A0A8ZLA4_ARUDO
MHCCPNCIYCLGLCEALFIVL